MNKNEESIFSSLDIRDPKQVFQNAIDKGLKNPQDYMYMHTEKGKDYFKHKVTRNYIAFNNSDKANIKDFLKKISIKDKIKAAKEKVTKIGNVSKKAKSLER